MANSELHIKETYSGSWRPMTAADLQTVSINITGQNEVTIDNQFVSDKFAANGDFPVAAVAGQSHYVTYVEGADASAAINDGTWTITPGATTLNFQGAPLKAAENTAIDKSGTITAMLYFTQ